jgi:tetratricopeptide (TPR) repeat protein
MPKLIVFIGNCQAQTLAKLYSDMIAPRTGETIHYIASYQPTDAAAARLVAEADVVVRQVLDFVPSTNALPTSARLVLFPLISAAFLWPCSGSRHPRSAPAPHLDQAGPYSAELGDSFLDRMIARGVPADEAVEIYLATDLPALRHVDRMRELVLDKQHQRDVSCGGYPFAETIDGRIGSEPLFRTAHHPAMTLTLLLAMEVFERMGASAESLAAISAYRGNLFPPTEAPIHPAIASHFGLTYADAQTRYRFHDEGGFTFAEFARRYMDYAWNPDLPLGFHLANQGEDAQAIEVLRRAVVASPRSLRGQTVLGALLERQGLLEEALDCARKASALAPEAEHLQRLIAHRERALAKEGLLF